MNERAEAMIELAENALADHVIEDVPGRYRAIKKQPVGVVLQIAPWNYPFITVINALAPSVLAGNAVMLKHSTHTPLCGEHFAKAFAAAGVPELVQSCFMPWNDIPQFIEHPEIGYVTFVGSTVSGRQIYQEVAARRFIDVGLELGGKDCSYVAADVDPVATADAVVDGSLYNSGQSCCAVERIYVHEDVYDKFL
jgi:acyl-CoA reductase-like NAD-dependent aldehyde dehydrogenase